MVEILRFFTGMTTSAMELLFSCAQITQYTICSQFNSWVAEVMGVKFLAKEITAAESPNWASLRLPCRQMPWQSATASLFMMVAGNWFQSLIILLKK